ncbi:MAG: histidine triad nucleotide-binding protein [Chloroflexi bacterium]|nr:histidine triad nucleotide-binding protein [Chloroflexota bacterium]
MTDCIFCKIVSGEIKGDIVHRDDTITAFRDVNPRAPTHILLVPNEHIPSAADLAPETAAVVGKMVVVANKLASEQKIGDGYRMVINCGPRAGQSVMHLHMHLMGGRSFQWPPG